MEHLSDNELLAKKQRLLLVAKECAALSEVCVQLAEIQNENLIETIDDALHKQLGKLDFSLHLLEEFEDVDIFKMGKEYQACVKQFDVLLSSGQCSTH